MVRVDGDDCALQPRCSARAALSANGASLMVLIGPSCAAGNSNRRAAGKPATNAALRLLRRRGLSRRADTWGPPPRSRRALLASGRQSLRSWAQLAAAGAGTLVASPV